MAFKMKGFPMQKGTGSYLKAESAARMKKEAAARMKKEAAASAAKQKYDKSDTDERVYDLDQKKYDKFRSTQGKKFPDIRYLGKKENKKFLEEYLKRKDNKIVSKSISESDKDSPAPQTARQAKKATKEARKFVRKANRITDRANKYMKRKGKDAGMVVDETGEKVERYELTPKQTKKVDKKKARAAKAFSKAKGVEAEFRAKYSSPAAQKKEHPSVTKYYKAVKDAENEFDTFIGKLHSEGRADTTGYSKTGGIGGLTTVDKKAAQKAKKDRDKKIKAAEKQAKKDGLTKAK
jgi:hypothetical protein